MSTAVDTPAYGTATSTGVLVITFGTPSVGFTWAVAVVVPTAPQKASAKVWITSTPKLPLLGSQPSGILEVKNGQKLSVHGTDFTAGNEYVAYIIGQLFEGAPRGISPAGPSTLVNSNIQHITVTTVKVTTLAYRPSTVTGLLSRGVTLTGSPVSVLASDEHFFPKIGFKLGGTPKNNTPAHMIWWGSTGTVTDNYDGFSAAYGFISIEYAGDLATIKVLGTDGDICRVAAE